MGKGNCSFSSEFNFHCDPEAAHLVLSSLPERLRTVLVPWETTENSSSPLEVVLYLT
jgi:inosine-uridine nucleoside N-ribohydrolase